MQWAQIEKTANFSYSEQNYQLKSQIVKSVNKFHLGGATLVYVFAAV